MLVVAQILGATAANNILFSKNGAIRSLHQEIVKYSAQQNIAMVKVMMRNLAQQNEQAYKDVCTRFSSQGMASNYKKIYEQILN